jgi:hypothetical protein
MHFLCFINLIYICLLIFVGLSILLAVKVGTWQGSHVHDDHNVPPGGAGRGSGGKGTARGDHKLANSPCCFSFSWIQWHITKLFVMLLPVLWHVAASSEKWFVSISMHLIESYLQYFIPLNPQSSMDPIHLCLSVPLGQQKRKTAALAFILLCLTKQWQN